jgi:hypothetical protein
MTEKWAVMWIKREKLKDSYQPSAFSFQLILPEQGALHQPMLCP